MAGIALALLVEALLLLALLSLGVGAKEQEEDRTVTVVSLPSEAAVVAAPEPSSASEPSAEELPEPPAEPDTQSPDPVPPEPRPAEARPQQPSPEPVPPLPPTPVPAPSANAAPASPRAPSRPSTGKVFGPPNRGGGAVVRDTERVGTAPNGEPLYAAAWYREPREDELRAYLSTARGPGWGVIACRTAPQYRVEDCVAVDEYPAGSQFSRAILAAAWELQVRPPRLGGRPQYGTWVQIKIIQNVTRN